MGYVAREKGPAKLNDLSFLCYISKMGIMLNTRMKQELNITPKIAEYEKILRMDSILGG